MRSQSLAILGTVLIAPMAIACPACEGSNRTEAAVVVEIRTLAPAQLQEMRTTQPIHVFDANPRDIFDKHHVPGAVHVQYDQVSALQLPADRSAPIVFYCMNERCGASPLAARRATQLGWTNVYLMPAGIQGWLAARLPVEPVIRNASK